MYSEVEFFTATCLKWQPLLTHDERKQVVIDSLRFNVKDGRIAVYGFVIMPNHIHVLWRKLDDWRDKSVEQMFLKFTAQQLKFQLVDQNLTEELRLYKSSQADREYHFWERRPWKAVMPTRQILAQKLHYIHLNPVRKGLCSREEDYKYSSASFYYSDNQEWDFLTHYLND